MRMFSSAAKMKELKTQQLRADRARESVRLAEESAEGEASEEA